MKQLFSLDSKFMQILMTLGDYIILNVVFLVCCVPIVTIGAAKSALYRVMFEMMEDKGNLYKKFFKCYVKDLKTTLPLFLLKGGVTLFLCWDLWLIFNNKLPLSSALFVIAVFLFLLLWAVGFSSVGAQVALFQSSFKQYLLNGIYIAITQPWRALAVGAMDIFPIVFYLLDPVLMMVFGPLWLFLYFSVTVNLSARLWKKPFEGYIKNAEDQEKKR